MRGVVLFVLDIRDFCCRYSERPADADKVCRGLVELLDRSVTPRMMNSPEGMSTILIPYGFCICPELFPGRYRKANAPINVFRIIAVSFSSYFFQAVPCTVKAGRSAVLLPMRKAVFSDPSLLPQA